MDEWFHPTVYNGCNYLSMLGLKLNHVSKRGSRYNNITCTKSIFWVVRLTCKGEQVGYHYVRQWYGQLRSIEFIICNVTTIIILDEINSHTEARTKWPSFCTQHFQYICLYEKQCILIWISLKIVSKGTFDNMQSWFRWWLSTEQAISCYLKQWWASLLYMCSSASMR